MMKDWREELPVRKPISNTNPHLCGCKAMMKGKWIHGEYVCIRCNKPVYDVMRPQKR